MGSGHHRGLDGQQPLQNGHSQGGTLLRIRTCSQLIQQQQILRLHLIQNLHQMCHMGRKGTEALLNALLVSDISIDIAIHRNLRAGLRRQKQAGLSHEHQKPQCFHGNGLTAGIWACYQQHGVFVSQGNIYRHHLVRCQQGMTGREKPGYAIFIDYRLRCLHFISQSCLGKGKIYFCHDFAVVH